VTNKERSTGQKQIAICRLRQAGG